MAVPQRHRGPTPHVARGGGLSDARIVLAALLALAFAVGVVVAGYFWLAGGKPDPSQAVVSAATGRSGPIKAPAPVDDGSWTDSDIKGCNDLATAAAEKAGERRLAAVSSDRVGLGGPDADVVQRATYLLCGATRKRLHLCESYWRDWFINAIKKHALDFKAISTSAYWTKVTIADRARKAQGTGQQQWQTLSDDLDQTTREVAKMHDDITVAFRSLIKDGIIDPGEFGVVLGFGIPPEIAAMIGGAQPERQLCG